ncbi:MULTISPECIES: hypothetical protein [Cyanophyceae]|uniref:hypothetical protein n=1 Tax=Cyanophyceae TaxID=3028117 RepID=UPI001681E742|nr:hypothetical protein [Trichocoleus sp. FACHB-40]MBD2007161.1 hypothetical protein [Trichocoleus sp. FACHB-40]
MTQNQAISDEKRQEILQRLRNRRGEARRFDINQKKTEDHGDPFMRTLLKLRDFQVDIARGADIAQQISDLGEDEALVKSLVELKQTRKAKKAAALPAEPEQKQSETSELGEDTKILEMYLHLTKAKRDAKKKKKAANKQQTQPETTNSTLQPILGISHNRLPENVSSADFVKTIQQLLGNAESNLSVLPLEQLEQRRKELQYRYNWMRSILEEMHLELDKLQDNIIDRLHSVIQSQHQEGTE